MSGAGFLAMVYRRTAPGVERGAKPSGGKCSARPVGRPRACKRLTHQAEPDRNGTTSREILAGGAKEYRDHRSISRTHLANKSLRR